MPYQYMSKDGKDENELILERCSLERKCNALTSFIDHMGFSTKCHFELPHLFNMSTGQECEHSSLIFRIPEKKGGYVKLNFCPFCGGVVSNEAYKIRGTDKKTGETREISLKYEVFSEQDYKDLEDRRKAKEAEGSPND